jgi:hypothetical protein
MIRSATLVALLGLACAAPSRTSAPTSGTTSAAPAKKDGGAVAASPLVCRTERPTGSNYPRRVCYRQEDLDEASLSAQDAHRRATSSSVQPRRD